jgi:predicted permease
MPPVARRLRSAGLELFFMRWWSDLAFDLRYGARLLRRSPGFTLTAGLSLAFGIAGTTAVFALVNAIVLRPLPVPRPHEIFVVNAAEARSHGELMAAPVFEDAEKALEGHAELFAASSVEPMQLWRSGVAAADRGRVQLVSGNYFDVLRQEPQAGRLLQRDDNASAGPRAAAVISDAYWRRHFDASRSAIGAPLTINGAPFTIVGVAARGFFGTTVAVRTPDVWVPFAFQPAVHYAGNASTSNGDTSKPWPPQREIAWLTVFARVPEQTAPATVAAALSLVLQHNAMALLPQNASEPSRQQARAERADLERAPGGVSSLRQNTSLPLVVLLAMVAVLLLIGCGNVAGLLLSRAASREREVAIRASIGAGRSRILRQFLAESLLLGVTAGAAGLGLAAWLHDPLLKLLVPGATAIDFETGVDWRVLGFAAMVSVGVGVACGLAPAIRGSRVALAESLKQYSRAAGSGGRRALMTGRALVTAQMGFSLLLLVLAGLFGRSLQSLDRTDIGFDREHLLVADVDVRGAGYAPSQRFALYQRLLDRLQRVPGVVSASLSENGPLNRSAWRSSFAIEGYTPAPGESLRTNEEIVAGDYFQTMGLRLLEGRLFEAQDRRAATGSTIVNATMAKRFFPGQSAIGKRWSYDSLDKDAFTIVGVVEDARYLNVRETPPNMAYHPAEFDEGEVIADVEVRAAGAPAALAHVVRQALAEVEPRLPVSEIVPLNERVSRNLSQDRLVAVLATAFGGLALMLACLGLYGTMSYGVSRRLAELALRMALGASAWRVLAMVMREALALVAIGAVVGLPLAFVAARTVGSLLYGVAPADIVSFGVGFVVLVAVAAVAAYIPAQRAARVSPMAALNR